MFYQTRQRDKSLLPHDPFKAIVAPRPIGWISTRNADGLINLAPYSFFNAFSTVPPVVGFSSEGLKDTASFARESGEFVANLASYDLMQAMNATSAPLPRGQSEFEHAGLTMAPCRLVRAPRVAECRAALECKVVEVVRLKNHRGEALDNYLVLGEVVAFHIDDALVREGRFDTASARPLGRCGYQDYAVVDKLIALARPSGGDGRAKS
ncbi:MAG: flavin reductase family protein [Roseiarcus sp.]|jgi:flavin reductase (DIM6/NTAB) family NADH-FMN oxidoreductase RutF